MQAYNFLKSDHRREENAEIQLSNGTSKYEGCLLKKKKKCVKAVDKSGKIDWCMKSFKSIDIRVREEVRNSS